MAADVGYKLNLPDPFKPKEKVKKQVDLDYLFGRKKQVLGKRTDQSYRDLVSNKLSYSL